MPSKPLVILSGNTVTTWDNFQDAPQEPFAFRPQGDLPLADIAWNHNGQGTCGARN
jgi:hypothetical protein